MPAGTATLWGVEFSAGLAACRGRLGDQSNATKVLGHLICWLIECMPELVDQPAKLVL